MAARSYNLGGYVASEGHTAVEGRRYLRDQSKRGIVACHGNGANGLTALSDPDHWPVYYKLADRGLCVSSADLGSPTAIPQWGNDTVRTRVGQAWSYLQTVYGAKTDKVILLALSGGTPAALNYARANPGNVAAIAVLIGLANVQDAYDSRGFAASIETAYGSAWAANAATHDPAAAGNQTALAGVPIKAWMSTDDTTAVKSVMDSYAASVNGAGGNMTVVSQGAQGHHTTGIDPNDIYDFLRPYVQ